MLKRLIEVAIPLKEVSEQAAKEKRQLSSVHLWWARRPPAACRAVLFASLIPDPDDAECPDDFRKTVMDSLIHERFRPTGSTNGCAIEDTPRNRCLEFMKHLVKWENTTNPQIVEPARRLVLAAHAALYPADQAKVPAVLDPFAGGGVIPLEAIRLGCSIYAVDLNPVAHLIELATVVYPQTFGVPDSRPVPAYISDVEAVTEQKGRQTRLFHGVGDSVEDAELLRPRRSRITSAEYRRNPLAADVKYWGAQILESTRQRLQKFYPNSTPDSVPAAYLWARRIPCPNPQCRARIPLVRSLLVSKKRKTKVALRMHLDHQTKDARFEVVQGSEIDFDTKRGTIKSGKAECPFCAAVVSPDILIGAVKRHETDQQLIAVVTVKAKGRTKQYRNATESDLAAFKAAQEELIAVQSKLGSDIVPNETMPSDRPSPNSRGLSAVVRYGLSTFGDLFNPRQALSLVTFVSEIRTVAEFLKQVHGPEYARAVSTYLAFIADKQADQNSILNWWSADNEQLAHTFTRQALSMVWDYAEANPFSGASGSAGGSLNDVTRFPALQGPILGVGEIRVEQGSATALSLEDDSIDVVVTDPPYYDSVPYSDLSDFFYVWLKRSIGDLFPSMFRTPLTPKTHELVAYYGKGKRSIQKTPEWYEEGMQKALCEMRRVSRTDATACVMFAHKTTAAWESLISGLLKAGFTVTASWPIHTERAARILAIGTAALASSVTLVCRVRAIEAGTGLWDDVRKELQQVARERLDFFWQQGIRGADLFISGIGPALSVFGKYERVTKLS